MTSKMRYNVNLIKYNAYDNIILFLKIYIIISRGGGHYCLKKTAIKQIYMIPLIFLLNKMDRLLSQDDLKNPNLSK